MNNSGSPNLERRKVRGDERPCTHLQKAFADGDGERRAFLRVGRGAQLVQQHQRTAVGLARDAVHVGDVRGKRGKVALDGLRIADVGVDGAEDGQARIRRGHGQTGLRHEREQAHRFQ